MEELNQCCKICPLTQKKNLIPNFDPKTKFRYLKFRSQNKKKKKRKYLKFLPQKKSLCIPKIYFKYPKKIPNKIFQYPKKVIFISQNFNSITQILISKKLDLISKKISISQNVYLKMCISNFDLKFWAQILISNFEFKF